MNTSESLFPDPTYFTHLKDLREAYSHRLNSRVIERMFKDPNEQTYEFELGIGGVYNFQIFIKAVEKNKRIHGIQNTRRIELSVQASRTVSEWVYTAISALMNRFTPWDLHWEGRAYTHDDTSKSEEIEWLDSTDDIFDIEFAFDTLPGNHFVLATVLYKFAEFLERQGFCIEGSVGFLKTESNLHGLLNILGKPNPADRPQAKNEDEISSFIARSAKYRETHPYIDAILWDIATTGKVSDSTRRDLDHARNLQMTRYRKSLENTMQKRHRNNRSYRPSDLRGIIKETVHRLSDKDAGDEPPELDPA